MRARDRCPLRRSTPGIRLRMVPVAPGAAYFRRRNEPSCLHARLLPASMMLTRSLVAVVCGALAVASMPGQSQQPFEDPQQRDQWVAHLDGPRPGPPKPSFPHPPPGDHLPPHGPPPEVPKFPFPPPPGGEHGEEPPHFPPGPPPPGAPHHPHHPKVDDKTIFQALGEDERFSRLYKLVNFTEDIVSILNDSSKSVTFFATPNHHLKPPKPPARKHDIDTSFDEFDVEGFFGSDIIETSDETELFSALEGFVDEQLLVVTDEDKEKKKKFLKKLLTAVLKYHILPEELSAHELAKNTTYPTSLTLGDGSLGSEALRLRVEQPPRLFKPTLSLNFYAKVVKANIKTKNGLIHVVNHPLFPPPSTFTTLFAFSDIFSVFTSAIQRVGLLHDIDWHWDHRSKSLEGAPAVTVFAPTNEAFNHLPPKLKRFLFSPFGHHALKKILSYHVVPDYVLHTNWAVNASDDDVVATLDHDNTYGQIPNGFDVSGFDLESELIDRTSDFSNDEAQTAPKADYWTSNADGARAWDAPRAQPEYDGYGFPGGEYGPPHGPHFPPPPHSPISHGPAHLKKCAGPRGPRFPPPPFAHGPSGPHGHHFPPPPPFAHGPHGHHCPPPPPPFAHGPQGPHCPPSPPPFAHGPHGPDGPHFPPPPFGHGGPEGPHFPPHYGHGPEGPHFPPPPPYYGHGPEGPHPHFPPSPSPHHGFGGHFPPPPPHSCHGGPEGPHFPPPPFGHGPEGPHFPPPPFGHGPEGPHFPPPPFGHGPEGPHFPPPPPFGHGPQGPHCPPPPPPPFGHSRDGPHFPPPPPFGRPAKKPHFSPPPPACGAPLHHEFPPKPVYKANATLPTLLANHTLSVRVAQFRSLAPHRQYTTALFVNGQWAAAADVPARNGAVHIVRRLLHPKAPPPGAPDAPPAPEMAAFEAEEPSWEDWEEWLPQWAAEA